MECPKQWRCLMSRYETEEIKEMASDYNISVETIRELLSMYDCLETITLLLDKLVTKDLVRRKLI